MNQRGLTLLEVLIAITISTLVLGSTLWLLSGGLDVRERVEKRGQASQELLVLAARLRTELPGVSSLVGSFQGEEKKLQFFYTTGQGLAQVEWELTADGIYTKSRRGRALDWSHPIKVATCWQGSFSYLDPDGGWKDSWQSKEKGLPVAVRLELTGRGKRSLTIPLEAGRAIPF